MVQIGGVMGVNPLGRLGGSEECAFGGGEGRRGHWVGQNRRK